MRTNMAYFDFPRPGRLAAALLLSALGLTSAARAQTLYNGPGAILAVTDSLLYVRGDANGKAFENAGEFNQTATPSARPRLFLDEGDLLNTTSGTWVQGLGTVVFNGASGATRTLSLNGATLHHLRIDNPAAGSNLGGVALGTNGTVDGVLRIANGHLLTTTNYQLRLLPTALLQGEADAHYVKGSVVQSRALSGGSAVNYSGIGFTANPQGQSLTLEVDRRAGLNIVNYSTGQNPQFTNLRGIDRIWRLSSPGATPGTPLTITLSWLPDNDNGLDFNSNLAQVWRSTDQGATWDKQGPDQSGASRTVSITTTVLNAWYTVSTTSRPLPVELTSFTVAARQLDAALTWTTATELNSDYFAVERSVNGQQWEEVMRQPAAGQSSRVRNYNALDRNAGQRADLLYYRLRQVDLDGSVHYSMIRTVGFTREALSFDLQAYPVPLQAVLTLDVRCPNNEPLTVSIYDGVGRQVLQQRWEKPAATNRYQLDVQNLPAGTFVLRATQGKARATRKLVKE